MIGRANKRCAQLCCAAALAVLAAACGSSEPGRADATPSPDPVDATVAFDGSVDASPAFDASPPDGGVPRSASVVDCRTLDGEKWGHTAEITDTTGYVPTGDATMPVGHFAQYVYADGGFGVTHTIVSGLGGAKPAPDGLFVSHAVADHGDLICILFDAPGTYPYYCGEHPEDEIGVITVTE